MNFKDSKNFKNSKCFLKCFGIFRQVERISQIRFGAGISLSLSLSLVSQLFICNTFFQSFKSFYSFFFAFKAKIYKIHSKIHKFTPFFHKIQKIHNFLFLWIASAFATPRNDGVEANSLIFARNDGKFFSKIKNNGYFHSKRFQNFEKFNTKEFL